LPVAGDSRRPLASPRPSRPSGGVRYPHAWPLVRWHRPDADLARRRSHVSLQRPSQQEARELPVMGSERDPGRTGVKRAPSARVTRVGLHP